MLSRYHEEITQRVLGKFLRLRHYLPRHLDANKNSVPHWAVYCTRRSHRAFTECPPCSCPSRLCMSDACKLTLKHQEVAFIIPAT